MARNIDHQNSNNNRYPPQRYHYPPNRSYHSNQYTSYPPYPPGQYYHPYSYPLNSAQYYYEKDTHSYALLSIVFAIIGLVLPIPFTGVISIILSYLAIKEINEYPERFKGRKIAIAGYILGVIQITIWIIVLLFFFSW